MNTILQTKNLTFMDFLNYDDLKIQKNTTTFIIGESGSGKTTLLKILNKATKNYSGEIFYNGENIANLDTLTYRKDVMLCVQEVFLFDDTIKNNFKTYRELRQESELTDEQMQTYLNICGANFNLDNKCNVLSGGEKQRVFLAICLSFTPKVLLLDEPTAALDEQTALTVMTNIKNFCIESKITLIINSHTKSIVDTCADFVIELKGGTKK